MQRQIRLSKIENLLLAGYATLTLFTFAANSGALKWMGLMARATGFGASIAVLVRLSTRPSEVEEAITTVVEAEEKTFEERERMEALLAAKEEALEQERLKMVAELEQQFQPLVQELNDREQSLEQRAKEIEEQYTIALQSDIQALEQRERLKAEEFQQELELKDSHIQTLAYRLAEAKGIKHASVARYGYAGMIANQIIEFFCDPDVDVPLNFEDCRGWADGEVLVWLKPYSANSRLFKIKQLLDDLQIALEIDTKPTAEIDEGCVLFTIDSAPKSLKARKAAKEAPCILSSEAFIEYVAATGDKDSEVNHYFISGESGGGKSTLINNILDYIKQDLGDKLRIIINDPKDPDSPWFIDGKEVFPDYRGMEESMEGLQAMVEDIEGRLEDARKEKYEGIKAPDRVPTVYLIDEAEQIVSEYGSDAGKAIKTGLRIGRSTKVKVVVIGQDPSCLAYGMRKANLRNAARIYIGDNALKGVEEVCSTTKEKKPLLELISRQQVKAEADSKEKYYCLVKVSGKRPVLAKMPPPNAFANLSISNHEIELEEHGNVDTLLDLIEEAKQSQSTNKVEELNDLLANSDRIYLERIIEDLPAHLKDVVDLAKDWGKWIKARDLQRYRDKYTKCNPDLIRDWFEELQKMGVGIVGETGNRRMYRFSPLTDSSDNPDSDKKNTEE